ncbi:GNAT family N-acetyltransferase [Neobacillus jeddahensis]|uniref:GNAT family N-acetyltransferase n=1 Tax=Neobacillus jeddahensis TaxID=1461580 RepID=UPI000590F983|nr:GNAT family N-acetyltransferase [Neobacillus jeddahensis]
MSIYFEEIKKETLYIVQEVMNSNPDYNVFENGCEARTLTEIEEFLNHDTISAFIKVDDTYIGVINYKIENPKDHFPWLGLLILHGDYQGYGYGLHAFELYENEMRKRGLESIRIGVLKENARAIRFFESLGFVYYISSTSRNGSGILCYQKQIS